MKRIAKLIIVILLLTIALTGCAKDPEPKASYNVFFNTNDGSLVDYISVEQGSTIKLPSHPIKRNYVFGGWYFDNNTFKSVASDALSQPINSDITVYAKWVSILDLEGNPKVTITLFDNRKINLVLCPTVAPLSVANFLQLVEEGYYTNTVFHRIIEGFVIQAGHMTLSSNTPISKPAKESIQGEFTSNGVPNYIEHKQGVLSMARATDYDSASTQFFICSADSPHLDNLYAAFGKVADAESLAIVIELSEYPTSKEYNMEDFPRTPDGDFVLIKSIEIAN